jgi:xanthine phosphoribosyltransferase
MDRVQERKYKIVPWEVFHADARTLANMLLTLQRNRPIKWEAIVCVTRGGMHPAAIIARELEIRVIETVCLALYDYQIKGGKVKVLKPVGKEFLRRYGKYGGDQILVVDDLVDTGQTARVIRAMLPKKLHYASLYSKPKGELQVNSRVDQVSQDTWILFPWDLGHSYRPTVVDMERAKEQAISAT